MRTEPHQAGGFLGNPDEALNPPASAGGCCGSPSAPTTVTDPAAAQAEGGCCGSVATEQAGTPAGCCG